MQYRNVAKLPASQILARSFKPAYCAQADSTTPRESDAPRPYTELEATPYTKGTTSKSIKGWLRQKNIPVNWTFVFGAAVIHLLWIWHIFSQKMLALPTKEGLVFGVSVIQAILGSVLGSDGEIALLEIPIFTLPLGLGELVACASLKRRSE
jgi:hypothetical protein